MERNIIYTLSDQRIKLHPLIMGLLFRKDIYYQIPDEDPVARQKFVLFRIFSLTAIVICFGVAGKMITTIENAGNLPYYIMGLGTLIMLNFYVLVSITRINLAYFILLSSAILLLHLVSYSCGGIRTAGTLYFGVIILYAYMLLGRKAGIIFTSVVITHIIYLFYISSYTNLTSFDFFNGNIQLINEDFLVNALFAFLLIAVQGNYLQSRKNEVIQRLEKQKDQLVEKTHMLEKSNEQLNRYSLDLEKKNEELKNFAYVASHDLKAPLRAIGSLTEFIEEEEIDRMSNESKNHFSTIKGRVTRMEKLINALLEYSMATETAYEKKEVNTKEMINNLIPSSYQDRKVNFKIIGEFPVLRIQPQLIENVFKILLSNAIMFNDKEEITISVSTDKNQFFHSFYIKDNGPGIDQSFYDKIFVIFQTLNSRDELESTGAGLAIAKKIVENLGGFIKVNSTKGIGCIFSFTVPCNQNRLSKTKLQESVDNHK